ncbi:M48 family metallopeptidase [Thiorhodovibrio frisius]|uniref:Putative metal-dependent hydrolase n=1 Tax=Thiorhodovibrio frisius TaxID=631362 RepID=H8Z0N8_9GAMM|nr:SprT family zinc-dependent metalloprotease [Thiorhodovibrio frisius]EIC22379.1 putative metal-dependent hydrolase [Thiorhodovibrio frisius]WPL24677.1 hypothetical protein Thiofri_04897 [Thiorhodovibrio frisius]
MSETLELDGLTFEVRRSARRRTLGLTVDRGGQLVMHAPETIAREALTQWAGQRLLWVHRTLARKQQSRPQQVEPEYVAGETFRYLGKPYPLVLLAEQDRPLVFDGHRFLLHRPRRAMAEQAFRRWYIDAGKTWVPERIERLVPRVGRAPSKVVVRDLGFRWGSCGRTGTINLNWRALQLPAQLIDYLLIHELCHLIEAKHNQAFWQAVERALPDWQARQQALDAQAAHVFWCHTKAVTTYFPTTAGR